MAEMVDEERGIPGSFMDGVVEGELKEGQSRFPIELAGSDAMGEEQLLQS